jgi:hypothetical protein
MTLNTKTLKFNKTEITFMEYQRTWMVPLKLIGLAMGYANEGQSLCDLVLADWQKDMQDGTIFQFEGNDLTALKKETAKYNVSFKQANSVTFVTMEGVIHILIRSRAKMAKEFRNYLVKNGGELLEGHKLGTIKSVKVKGAKPTPVLEQKLSEPLAILKQAQESKVFSKETIAGLYLELFRSAIPLAVTPAQRVLPAKNDATQMVPVSNVQTSSLTPNFDSVRGFFLTGHQKHPKFPLWITAEEIGATVGKTADQVKVFLSRYMTAREAELSNVTIMDRVKNAGGYFKGVAAQLDENQLPCFMNAEVGCLAVWFMMEDGKTVWRNYWSPRAVNQVRGLMGLPALEAKAADKEALRAERIEAGEPEEGLTYLPPDLNYTNGGFPPEVETRGDGSNA